jgi:two-component system sensor histidine kinase KdpD
MFLVAALICGRLANHLHVQLLEVQAANARTEALKALSQRLAVAVSEGDIGGAATSALREVTGAEAAFVSMQQSGGRLGEPRALPEDAAVDALTRMAAKACLDSVGDGGEAHPMRMDFGWWCLPLVAGEQRLGVLCLRFAEPLSVLPTALSSLAQLMSRSVADALARVRLARELEASRVRAETERLRAALLSSVSHDLRSPLSTIIGSAESLKLFADRLSVEDRATLAADILGEGLRLDRYIQNLLDMTRLGEGAPALPREWLDLEESFAAATARLKRSSPLHTVEARLDWRPALLFAHPALLEQALFNLLDNAAKFSPAERPLQLTATRSDDEVVIEVVDRGAGIPAEARERVFDMFYSVEQGDRGPAGSGLGLTICQGVVAAHGGSIEALAGEDGVGTRMRIRLPYEAPPAEERDAA